MIEEFPRIRRLPPYVFNIVNDLKAEARSRGEDIIDFGMGNPDQPTPAGWQVEKPRATMFVWAQFPERYRDTGSLEFSKKLLSQARVAVSPGIGFGEYGNDHVRFSLIENEHRTRQAVRGIRQMLRDD